MPSIDEVERRLRDAFAPNSFETEYRAVAGTFRFIFRKPDGAVLFESQYLRASDVQTEHCLTAIIRGAEIVIGQRH